MTPLEKLEELFYNKSECAKALGITRQRLNGWYSQGFIPYKNGMKIQKATKGKIEATEVWQAASLREVN